MKRPVALIAVVVGAASALVLQASAQAEAKVTGLTGQIAYSYGPLDSKRPAKVGDSQIFAMPAAGGASVKVAGTAGDLLDSPSYSPDGTKIAWNAGAYGKGADSDGIYVANRDGSGAKLLVPSGWVNGITWTPDGKSIVFVDVSTGIFTVPADGSAPPRLLLSDPKDFSFYTVLSVTPDGKTLVFEHEKESSNLGAPHTVRDELWKVQMDGTGVSQFLPRATGPRFATDPQVAPDGKHVVFDGQAKAGDRVSLFIAPIDGTSFRKVWTAPAHAWIDRPTWSPDGTKIVLATGGSITHGARLVVVDPTTAATHTIRTVKTGEISGPTWTAAAPYAPQAGTLR